MEFLFIILIIICVIVIPNIKIVPQANSFVVERLGSYFATWKNGLHFKIPFIDRISNKVTLKEIVKDFAPQPVITKDNVTMQIDTVVYFQITDPKLYTYGVERPINALENLTATTLRNIVGELELDGTLTSRDTINGKMTSILDEATDKWGIKVRIALLFAAYSPFFHQSAEKSGNRCAFPALIGNGRIDVSSCDRLRSAPQNLHDFKLCFAYCNIFCHQEASFTWV